MDRASRGTPGAGGEFGLIRWIREREAKRKNAWAKLGIGDDCAILGPAAGDLLVTTDMLMDGRHFRLEQDGPEAVGFKAFGVNISDIAAMAGVPRAALVAVALPRKTAAEVARGLDAGLRRMSERFAVELIGGDTNAWDGPLVITVTLFGEATERGAVLRSGARVGDVVLVTGPLGGSLHAGRHLRPQPRVAEALAIHRAVEIRAMIDLSDGISSDLRHILDESGGLGAELDAALVPIHDDAMAMSGGDRMLALGHALDDGEDFELCFVVAPEDAETLLANPPEPARLYRVGRIEERAGLRLRLPDGHTRSVTAGGFDHFRSRG